MLLLLLLLAVEGRGEGGKDSTSLLANVGCDGRSGKKELLDMSVALLHAHRLVVQGAHRLVVQGANRLVVQGANKKKSVVRTQQNLTVFKN